MQALMQLSLREKFILMFALVALLGLSFHAFIWQPLTLERAELVEQLEQEKEDLVWIQQNINRLKGNVSAAKAIKGSLVSWLDLQVTKHQLKSSLKRIKPRGDKEVKIWLEEANVKQLMYFLGDLSQYTVTIKSLKMLALDKPGISDVNIVLVSQ